MESTGAMAGYQVAKRLGVVAADGAVALQFAELFAEAEDVFQSTDCAVQWMLAPAMALENRRPVDLITTPAGVRLVDAVLERMRYGVYQ